MNASKQSKARPPARTGHLVSMTHWDREWFLPFEVFRMHLTRIVDGLIEILDRDVEFKSFTLDGQTVVLEDYLEIRPEMRERLAELIRNKRIYVGPWYVLPDEFLVSGEALVRNLMIGHQTARRMGHVMRVGYVPDPFGHVAQLPQILNGFGIDNFIFTRGLGDEADRLGAEFRWRGPDGRSEVLALWQARGYCCAAILGYTWENVYTENPVFEMDRAQGQIGDAVRELTQFSRMPDLLLNNGCDQLPAQPEVPAVIRAWNDGHPELKLVHSSFERYVGKIRPRQAELNVFTGEMRGQKYFWLLPGVLSARMYLKQANHAAQRALERWAEPLAAMAESFGRSYPRAILLHAWKMLLKNQPHDDICGCSIDAVHQDMMNRYRKIGQVTEELIAGSMAQIARRTDTRGPEGCQPLMVFNTSGQAIESVERHALFVGDTLRGGFEVVDRQGRSLPAQVEFGDVVHKVVGIAPVERMHEARLSLELPVPALGYRTVYLKPQAGPLRRGEKEKKESRTRAAALPHAGVGDAGLRTNPRGAENVFYKLAFAANGSFSVTCKATGRTYKGLGVFEDCEDVGDLYDYDPAAQGERLTTRNCKATVTLACAGPLAATYEIVIPWEVPAAIAPDRKRRSQKTANQTITSHVTLYARSPRIDIETMLENRACDHRLRALFPSGLDADNVLAGDSFTAIRRPIALPEGKGWVDPPTPNMPFKDFVSVMGEEDAFALFSRGLPEYEALRGRDGVTLALTLFRAVGWLSRDDLSTRHIRAAILGPPIATPEAQCLGPMRFEYALMTDAPAGDWAGRLANMALRYDGVRSFIPSVHAGSEPDDLAYLKIEGGAVLSAVKKPEEGEGLIVRLFNPGDLPAKASLTPALPMEKAMLTRIDERPVMPLPFPDRGKDCLNISLRPYEIVTVWIKFKKNAVKKETADENRDEKAREEDG